MRKTSYERTPPSLNVALAVHQLRLQGRWFGAARAVGRCSHAALLCIHQARRCKSRSEVDQ